jgi:methylmalonyl-CoA mutase N-terminal domain/subunit
MGGAQSIFTCAFDEAYQIPTEFSAEIAVRTQQIVAYESGIARTVDPLGGSYFLEQHTDRMEAEIEKVMAEIDTYGGVVQAIEDGWIQLRLAERALERKRKTDSGDNVVVGLNHFATDEGSTKLGELFTLDSTVAQRVQEKYRRTMETRDAGAVDRSLAALSRAAANDSENVMPYLVDCCHAYATVGEMVACLKREWGEFQEPVAL